MEIFSPTLNPSIDIKAARETYLQRGVVRIENVMTEASAEALIEILSRNLAWRTLFVEPETGPVHFSDQEMAAKGQAWQREKGQRIKALARDNFGYFYRTYPLIEAYIKGWDQGHPIHRMTEFLNGEDFIELGRRIVGERGIVKAEAHATSYGPGHFLTRHLDNGEDGARRAAYVLGLSKGWMPDWGGLLLFLNERQDIDSGFLPTFNTLTIFDIGKLHTVTQVATFAGANRYAVAGWLRNDR